MQCGIVYYSVIKCSAVWNKLPYHNFLLYFYIKLITYRVFMFFLAYIFIGLTFFVFKVNVTDNFKVLRLVYSI